GDLFIRGRYSVADLQVSIEESLKALRTDRVDLLFIHAPPHDVLEQGDLFEELERLVRTGKVLQYGISGELPVVLASLQRRPGIQVGQFDLPILNRARAQQIQQASVTRRAGLVAHQPFGGV